jgi:iron complex transport system ATP-binding protein
MLEARNVTVRAGGRELVSGLDLVLEPGQCWALLGPNGAGKSSLLFALAGLRPAGAGAVTLSGKPLSGWRRGELARRVGILLQDDTPEFWGSALEYARLGRYPHAGAPWDRDADGDASARGWLARLDLAGRADQAYATLSGGERQRARIAQLLVQDPALLLLDEPLSHLDLRHQVQVMEILAGRARGGGTVLMALHQPSLAARYCDHAVLLYDAGRSSAGTCADMLTRSRLEALYRCPLESAGLSIPT